jgi:hypothetical protein
MNKATPELSALLNEKLKIFSKKNKDAQNLQSIVINNNSEDLIQTIDSILINIKNLSDDRDFFEAYYNQISGMMDLKDHINFYKMKRQNKNYMPEVTKPVNNILKSKIYKDELMSPNDNPKSTVKNNQVTQMLVNNDDQFDHDF